MALISKPLNETQEQFNRLCLLGGGVGGGPARGKVLELLRASGQALNTFAFREVANQFHELPDANPWHVCFAIGLCWGHLAKFEIEFTTAAVSLMSDWNDHDLRVARRFHLERGVEAVERSLRGGHMMFEKVALPAKLPNSLKGIQQAQDRWLGRVLAPDKPSYIGSWNATAMFMIALFAQPILAKTYKESPPILPPGGPIFSGLDLLYRANLLSSPPDRAELDESAFEPGVLYVNNALLNELCRGLPDWSLIDVHSAVYMLGTRSAQSASYT
jgi:hypothetical protein